MSSGGLGTSPPTVLVAHMLLDGVRTKQLFAANAALSWFIAVISWHID